MDADLIGRNRHRFPNLAVMKISRYEKEKGNAVKLLLDYTDLNECSRAYVSKVFTDTPFPDEYRSLPQVQYGGTGFFFDKAQPLPFDIEHTKPDYHIYDRWVLDRLTKGEKRQTLDAYLNYSIGFLTRGCFRGCPFCVNQNAKRSCVHSPVSEFLDPSRKKIYLLDDNFLACGEWERLLDEVNETGKPFRFHQGLDERLLTEKKIRKLFAAKLTGDLIFAFDDIADTPVIVDKLSMIQKLYPEHKKSLKFYCFTGFDRADGWDDRFWIQDVFDLFERIRILFSFRALPYVMRHARYEDSPHRGMYITLARWCNQPSFVKKVSFRVFCEKNGVRSAAYRYAESFEAAHPEVTPYYDMVFGDAL